MTPRGTMQSGLPDGGVGQVIREIPAEGRRGPMREDRERTPARLHTGESAAEQGRGRLSRRQEGPDAVELVPVAAAAESRPGSNRD